MKKFILFLSIPAIILCCKNVADNSENQTEEYPTIESPEESQTDVSENAKTITDTEFYHRFINPEAENLVVGDIYTDTFKYLFFDDNYDYEYMFFETSKNDTLRFVYGSDAVTYDELLELKGKMAEVSWKIKQFSEAGEGEKPYLDRRVEKVNFLK